MSALRSALDELAAEALEGSSSDALESDLVEIRRALDVLESEFLRRVAEVGWRRSFERHGYLSVASFLVDRCGLGGAAAGERVRVSRALRHMPVARRALADGDLSYAQTRFLAQARDAQPEAFADHEVSLVDAAAQLSLADTRRLVDHWRQAVLPDEATARMEAMTAERRLFVSRTFAGMIRLDGWFDPVDGDTILTALAAATAEKDKARDETIRLSAGRTVWPRSAGNGSPTAHLRWVACDRTSTSSSTWTRSRSAPASGVRPLGPG